MSEYILIEKLLMPPVGNHRHIPVRTRTKGRISPIKGNGLRLIKAPEFREYDNKIDLWILRNKSFIEMISERTNKWIEKGFCLQLEIDYCFPLSKTLSQKNQLKEIDIDGRRKTVQDTVAKILRISDKWIIRAIDQKPIEAFNEEHLVIRITPIKRDEIKLIKNDGPLQSSKVTK